MRLSLFAAAALVASSLAAHADTFTTFDLNSEFAGGNGNGTVTGTLILDTTTSLFTSANLTASGFIVDNGEQSVVGSQGDEGSGQFVAFIYGSGQLSLRLPISTLMGYNGSSIKTGSSFGGLLYSTATSGSLTPEVTAVATTPEPSSIALLGTGILGVFGVMKRRFA